MKFKTIYRVGIALFHPDRRTVVMTLEGCSFYCITLTVEECNIGNFTTRETQTNNIVFQHIVLMQRPENFSLFSIVITKVHLWTPC